MSKCSKKCNEIKQKIDSVSGLNDDFVYARLEELEDIVKLFIKDINDYADKEKTNGTCFK